MGKAKRAKMNGEMEVIGAGLGRTGTDSLRTALNILGYKTHHMYEVGRTGQAHLWQQIARGVNVQENLRRATVGYGFNASVDFPTCGYFEELQSLNPRAKVILSVRDSAEAWERSASATIMQSAYNNPFRSGILYHALKWLPFG